MLSSKLGEQAECTWFELVWAIAIVGTSDKEPLNSSVFHLRIVISASYGKSILHLYVLILILTHSTTELCLSFLTEGFFIEGGLCIGHYSAFAIDDLSRYRKALLLSTLSGKVGCLGGLGIADSLLLIKMAIVGFYGLIPTASQASAMVISGSCSIARFTQCLAFIQQAAAIATSITWRVTKDVAEDMPLLVNKSKRFTSEKPELIATEQPAVTLKYVLKDATWRDHHESKSPCDRNGVTQP